MRSWIFAVADESFASCPRTGAVATPASRIKRNACWIFKNNPLAKPLADLRVNVPARLRRPESCRSDAKVLRNYLRERIAMAAGAVPHSGILTAKLVPEEGVEPTRY